MLDDILDLFTRDRNDRDRQRHGTGIRGLLDRLGDHDDDRPSTHSRKHNDDWDDDDHRPQQDSGRRRRERSDWFDEI